VPFPPDKKVIDIGSFYADDTKIRQTLGWRPRVSLREGLSKTLAFYRQHRVDYWGDEPDNDAFSTLGPFQRA
jgi:UDP-glucose 4-epimerase